MWFLSHTNLGIAITMKKFRYILAICLSVVMCICTTGCTNTHSNKSVVRIACFPNITHSQALYAQATGSMESALGEECEVSWHTFNAGPSEILALFSNSIDIGYIGPIPAINGYIRSNGDLKIIAGATNAGAMLVTRKDLVLNDISELAGCKIAVPQFNNTQDIILRDLIAEAGLSDAVYGGDVEIIASENANTKLLLDKGDIDAAFVPEPWATRLINEVGANILLSYNEIYSGNYPSALIVVSTRFLEAHPDIVEKFIDEHIRITEYINSNKKEVIPVINAQIEALSGSKFDDKLIEKAFDSLIFTHIITQDDINTVINACKNADYIDKNADVSNILLNTPHSTQP